MAGTVSDFPRRRLHDRGVRGVLGYPGDGLNGLIDALDRAEGAVEPAQVRHGAMAALMAGAHAKYTGEVGVCVATSGRRAIHLLHHHAVAREGGESALLERLGLDFETLQTGCCGMAGSFGVEADQYEVSRRIAEQAPSPALHAAEPEAWVVAAGFPCREQIESGTRRGTVHVAELAGVCPRRGG